MSLETGSHSWEQHIKSARRKKIDHTAGQAPLRVGQEAVEMCVAGSLV